MDDLDVRFVDGAGPRGDGVDLDDLGFEKLWEWAGPRESRERMVAQLLLMATNRARRVGLTTEDVLGFVRTAME